MNNNCPSELMVMVQDSNAQRVMSFVADPDSPQFDADLDPQH